MRRVWAFWVCLLAAATFVLSGCGGKETPPPKPSQGKTASDTTVAAKQDTAPEPPPGFKSIHQLELEEHK